MSLFSAVRTRPATFGVWAGVLAALLAASGCKKTQETASANSKTKARAPRRARTGSQNAPSASKAPEQGRPGHPGTSPRAQPRLATPLLKGAKQVRRAVYRLTLMGKDVGRLVQAEFVFPDRIRTEESAEISMTRGASQIHMKIQSLAEERPDGTPISFSVLLDQGPVKIQSKGTYQDGTLIVEDQSGKREIPYDSKWLFPAAAERKILAAGFAKGTKLEFFQFDPLMGMTGKKVTMEALGDSQVTWQGNTVSCHRVRMTVGQLSPGTACVDDANVPYESTMSFGAVSLHLSLVSKTQKGHAHLPDKPASANAAKPSGKSAAPTH